MGTLKGDILKLFHLLRSVSEGTSIGFHNSF